MIAGIQLDAVTVQVGQADIAFQQGTEFVFVVFHTPASATATPDTRMKLAAGVGIVVLHRLGAFAFQPPLCRGVELFNPHRVALKHDDVTGQAHVFRSTEKLFDQISHNPGAGAIVATHQSGEARGHNRAAGFRQLAALR